MHSAPWHFESIHFSAKSSSNSELLCGIIGLSIAASTSARTSVGPGRKKVPNVFILSSTISMFVRRDQLSAGCHFAREASSATAARPQASSAMFHPTFGRVSGPGREILLSSSRSVPRFRIFVRTVSVRPVKQRVRSGPRSESLLFARQKNGEPFWYPHFFELRRPELP